MTDKPDGDDDQQAGWEAAAGLIHYLNTDLDVTSADDLTALAAAFETKGMYALHVNRSFG
jgi:hypothetical protein